MTMPKYSLPALWLVISLVVVHANAYVFPQQVMLRHLVLWVYLLYGARQYYKFMHDDGFKNTRKTQRDPNVPAEVYGRLAAEKAIKDSTVPVVDLLVTVPPNSIEYLRGYKQRIEEELQHANAN